MKANHRQFVSVFILFILVFSQFAHPQPASAACSGIIYVDADSTAPTPDGCGWATAFPTLQDALAIAASGDQVWVAQGTYYPDEGGGETTGDRMASFKISGVSLYGGYAGIGAPDPDLRNPDPETNNTILSGDLGTPAGTPPVGYTDNSYHVVRITNITTATVLDGFTITKGYANGSGDETLGAGFYIVDVSNYLTLTNLLITDNRAPNNNGGGMFLKTILGSPVSIPHMSHTTFDTNRAERGGGLFAENSDPILDNVIFKNNDATAGAGGGANIQTVGEFDPPASPQLTNVIFEDNHAKGGGGLFIGNSNSTGKIENITFVGNNVDRRGGGLLLEVSTLTLTNITFYGNTSADGGVDPQGGGGMMLIGSIATLNNVTFNSNDSAAIGGDAIRSAVSSTLTITNSIFWGDADDEITDDGTGSISISDSVVEGGFTGTNIITTDPLLGALADNGGFTKTMTLGTGSAAIDQGNNSTCAATDQRGVTRPQGTACDMGAYEALTYTLTITTVGNGTVTRSDPGPYFPDDIVNLTAVPATGWSFTDWSGDITSINNPVAVTVTSNMNITANFSTSYTAPVVTLNPIDQTVIAGESVSFSAAATGDPIPSIQWQISTDEGATYNDILGANSTTLNLTPIGKYNGSLYRAVFSNLAGSATTLAATLSVTPGPFDKKPSPVNGAISQPTSLTLSWYASSGATSYEYCYDTTDDGSCSNWINTGTTRSASVSGLNPSTTYYWQVRAINNTGITYANGSETAFWSFSTGSLPGSFNKKTPPVNGATSQPTSLTLSWYASSGAVSYEYCYDTTDDGSCNDWINTGTTRSVGVSGLSPSTTYYWQVRANNSMGNTYANGSETAFWSFTTGSLPGSFNKKTPPVNGATSQPTSLTLSWYASSGAVSYEYCYDATDDGSCSNWINTGTTRSASVSGLNPSTTYYWQVRANNSMGSTYANGSETAFWSFSTGSLPGSFNKKTPPVNGATSQPTSLTLSWYASSGATSYEYCYDTTDDGSCNDWINTGTTRSVSVSGLNPSTTYYWQVRANNSMGFTYANGSEAAFWSFTTAP